MAHRNSFFHTFIFTFSFLYLSCLAGCLTDPIPLSVNEDGCREGDIRVCAPIGECQATQTCVGDGIWGNCEAVLEQSSEEVPDDARDNDCDGSVDENLEVVEEICDGLDNDEDGNVDEEVDCQCDPGATRQCGIARGVCAIAVQQCEANGRWEPCPGLDQQTAEVCDGINNDCDAFTDEEASPQEDPNHCGTCNYACADQLEGSTLCVQGQCRIACISSSDCEVNQLCVEEGYCANTVVQYFKSDTPSRTGYYGASVDMDGNVAVVSEHRNDTQGENAGVVWVYSKLENGTWGNRTQLTPENIQAENLFGNTVAIQGELIVVGAPGYDIDGFEGAGAAYVFERTPEGDWSQIAQLLLQDPETNAGFGGSIDIDGDFIVVGAPEENAGEGAVYIFERQVVDGVPNWNNWVSKLVADQSMAGARFGNKVSIQNDTLVIGAPIETVANPVSMQDLSGAGAVYVFEREDPPEPNDPSQQSNWNPIQRITSPQPREQEHFGNSIDMSENHLVVGANTNDQGINQPGATYVFQSQMNDVGQIRWEMPFVLVSSNSHGWDSFGSSVRIQGHLVVVGAPFERHSHFRAGTVYFFSLRNGENQSEWVEVGLIRPEGIGYDSFLGSSVALDESTIVVGAIAHDGDQFDSPQGVQGDPLADAGAAYIFTIQDF